MAGTGDRRQQYRSILALGTFIRQLTIAALRQWFWAFFVKRKTPEVNAAKRHLLAHCFVHVVLVVPLRVYVPAPPDA
jgi:hypothetical protein